MMQIFLELIGMVPLFTVVGLVVLKARQLKADDRRDPITTELRCLPGDSLQDNLDKLTDWRMDRVVLALTAGMMAALFIATRRVGNDTRPWDWMDTTTIVASTAFALYLARQITSKMPIQRKLKQAIRAEHATAQELAASLTGSNRIIHDVQAKDFNIDHVVITLAGIFAVETKSRLKPPSGQGAAAVKVRYDGRQLDFPSWTETKPIQQAARQARWLSDYLQQSTGETFPVFAVLALPGWYVENTARITDDMVRVINPKKAQWLLLPEKPVRLDGAAIQRAAFQIEKLAQSERT